MIGSTAQPVTAKKLKNISPHDTSSNQEAVVVPYFAGVAKLALTWISPMYNLHKVNEGGQSGKKGVGASPGQDKWYADIAGVACICPDDAPVDFLLYVLVNDEIAFTGTLPRGVGDHYAAITLETYCQEGRIYWGTKDSPTDNLILYPRQSVVPVGVDPRVISTWPALDANGDPWEGDDPPPGLPNPYSGHYDFHPAYRNNCYFVFRNFFLGSSPNMPNVAVVIARGTKFFGATRFEPVEAGVNPMGPLYEILTDPLIGAGLPESALDQTSFEATATALTAENMFLAPVLREAKTVRAFVADYLEYFDGFLRRNGDQIDAGYFDHGDINQTGLLELDSDDISGGEPQITPGTLEDTKNHCDVVYTNRLKWWTDDAESFRHLANIQATGERRPDRQQRPFIIDPALAQRFVTERGMMVGSVSGGSGSAGFLYESVRDHLPGDRFKLLSTSFGLTMLMRCLSKDGPAAGESIAKLQYAVELADRDHLYVQPPAPKDDDFIIEAFAIQHARIVELPGPLREVDAIEVAVLAERPSPHVIGFHTHVSTDDVTYDQVTDQIYFAVRGKIKAEAYVAETDLVDETVGMVVDLYGLDLEVIRAQSVQQRDDLTILIWMNSEIGSMGDETALGNGRFRIFMRRACYGTIQALHAIDTEVWFVFRRAINAISHASFLPAATDYFKLQPYTPAELIDIAEVDPITHTFADGPFILNDLELWGQGEDHVFLGSNPRFRWSIFDITGLGFFGLPGVVPAAYNATTGLWHDLIAQGAGDDYVLGIRQNGTATAPAAGTPYVYNETTALWYPITASGVVGEVIPSLDSAGGTATVPPAGVPIVFNATTGNYHRLSASGTGDDVIPGLEEGFAVGPGNPVSDTFLWFELRVRDYTTGTEVWTAIADVPEHIFTREENALATGQPRRQFFFGVRAVYQKMDSSLGYTDWLERFFENPQHVGKGGDAVVGADRIDFRLNPSTDLDYLGSILWVSDDPAFTVTDPLVPGVEILRDGPEQSYSVPQPPATTRYYRSASYDVFSPTDHTSQAFLDDILISDIIPYTTP